MSVSLRCSPAFNCSIRRGRRTACWRGGGIYSFVVKMGVGIRPIIPIFGVANAIGKQALSICRGVVIEHVLEVHWSPFPPQLVPRPDVIWSRKRSLQFEGYEAPVLDDAATIVHLAWHYVQHQGTELRILREMGVRVSPADVATLSVKSSTCSRPSCRASCHRSSWSIVL